MNRDLWLTNDATIPGQLATVRETPVIGCGRLLIQRSSNSQLLYRVININANLSAAKGQVSKYLSARSKKLILFGWNSFCWCLLFWGCKNVIFKKCLTCFAYDYYYGVGFFLLKLSSFCFEGIFFKKKRTITRWLTPEIATSFRSELEEDRIQVISGKSTLIINNVKFALPRTQLIMIDSNC